MNLKKCRDCKTEYYDQDAERFGHCPKCDSEFFTILSPQDTDLIDTDRHIHKKAAWSDQQHLGDVPGFTDTDKLIAAQNKNTQDLIQAQNRTTHAVRAFVRFLFIQLSGLTLVYFTWSLSEISIDPNECARYGEKCEGNLFFQVLAIVIWIGTVIFSSRAGWSELEKSDV